MRRIVDRLQFDKPLAYAMAARLWQSLSGPITILFLVRGLTLPEQGIYYSLVSILSIQMFFELGLLNILVSQAGHQATQIDTPTGHARTQALIRSSLLWFGWASLLFAATALAVGWQIMLGLETSMTWRGPLLAMVIASAVTVAMSPAVSILEGFGFREDVYRVRCLQMVVGSVVVWGALSAGMKLWSLSAAAIVQALTSVYLVSIRHRTFFSRFSKKSGRLNSLTGVDSLAGNQLPGRSGVLGGPVDSSGFSWTRDVVPIQWRMALLSAVYHFATQFFTVIVLEFHSAAEAGRLGLTLSLTGAIQALGLAWVQTKFSLVAIHHGAGDREAAGTLWRSTAVNSTGLLVLALSVAGMLLGLMPLANVGLEQRFITPAQFTVLSIGIVANHFIALQGYYVTSRRARPLMFAAMTGFTSTAIAVWVGGFGWSTPGVLVGYTATTVLITLPLHTRAYLRYRASSSRPSPRVG